jgi:hypothetical protein
MNMLKLFQKPIVLHCYTDRADVFNYMPIEKASKFTPDWWKALPSTFVNLQNPLREFSTMKHCAGFTDLFTKGFILPLWSDVAIQIGKLQEQKIDNYTYQFADGQSTIGHHSDTQYGSVYPLTHYQHIKIGSPWKFMCNSDVEFLALQPTWNFETPEKIFIPPAIVNFKHQSTTAVNMFFKRNIDDTVHNFQFGQPLLHFIPLTEKKIKLQTHLVSSEVFKNLREMNTPVTFTQPYKARKKIIQESGCPFHFRPEK